MRKVYGNIHMVVFSGLFFFAFIFMLLNKAPLPLFCFYTSLVFWCLSLFLYFFPSWSYGEEGFEQFVVTGNRRFRWEDVDSLVSNKSGYGAVLTTKNGRGVVLMATVLTRNYFSVLAEVVDLLKKKNPEAKISAAIFKRLQKPPKFTLA